jgi:peptidoglycan/LPS O-acetylase OafA/YrhL/Tfp pilus assembly protein PilF
MVLAYHERVLAGGFLGVDLFFVLSGYLITTILLKEWQRANSIALGRFYARRLLRLGPPLCVFVLIAYGVTHWIRPGLEGWLEGRWALAALLYFSNLWIAFLREYPLGVVSICWSLAIEEQFYLLWPLGLKWLLERRVRLGKIACLLAVPIGLCGLLRQLLLWGRADDPTLWLRVYFAPDTRADTLLIGCLLGLMLRGRRPLRFKQAISAGALASAALLAYLAATFHIEDFVLHPTLFTASAVASAFLILIALVDGWVRTVLEWPILVWVGRISYSLYLWHYAGLLFMRFESPFRRLAFVFLLAAASHYLVERPIEALKLRLGSDPRPQTSSSWGDALRGGAALVGVVALGWVRLTGAALPLLGLPPLVRARERWEDRDLRRAVAEYRMAAAAANDSARVWAELGEVLGQAGSWSGAVAAYDKAIAASPGESTLRVSRCVALGRAGNLQEAQSCFASELARNPGAANTYRAMGELATDQGRLSEAIAAFSKGLEIQPADAGLRNDLGIALALSGRLDEAIQHFRASLQLKSDPQVTANLSKARRDRASLSRSPAPK